MRIAAFRTLRPLLNLTALAWPTMAGLLVAGAAASEPSFLVPASRGGFPGWLAGPLAGSGIRLSFAGFGVILLTLLASYVLALAWSARTSRGAAITAIVSAHLAVILAPPLLSADVFGYLGYARLGALHGVSPYAHGAAALAGDPVHPFVLWHDVTSPYGPLFTASTYALAPLRVPAAIWILKVIAGASSLGCVALVWTTAARLRRAPVPAALFVGLNPLLLIFGVGGAHNDLLVATVVTAAVALLVAERDAPAGAAVVGAMALKISVGIVAPYLFIAVESRRGFVRGASICAVLTLVIVVAIFGAPFLGIASALRGQQQLTATHSVPDQVGRLLGLGGVTLGIRVCATAGLLGALALTLTRASRGSDWIAMAGWATLALLLTTTWLLPWYVVWLLPLAALGADSRLRLVTVALCAVIVAGHVPFLLG